MKTIVLASGNTGKIDEINHAFAATSLQFIPQTAFGIHDVAETGLSFVENALIKARNAASISGLPALADDSGLVVDALMGAPGIYSARYAGATADMEANIKKLLLAMAGITHRQARFYSVIVYLRHATDPTPIICQGRWEGEILRSPQGKNGFGYDPIFYVSSHQCSAAELSLAQKNLISHRGQALAQLIASLGLQHSSL